MTKRLLLLSIAPQFAVSCALLIWASVTSTPIPWWGGILDAILAFTIVGTAMWLHVSVGRVRAAYVGRIYTAAALLPSLLLVLVWLARDRVDLNILLPGLAWRLFIVLEMLPLGAAVWSEAAGFRLPASSSQL